MKDNYWPNQCVIREQWVNPYLWRLPCTIQAWYPESTSKIPQLDIWNWRRVLSHHNKLKGIGHNRATYFFESLLPPQRVVFVYVSLLDPEGCSSRVAVRLPAPHGKLRLWWETGGSDCRRCHDYGRTCMRGEILRYKRDWVWVGWSGGQATAALCAWVVALTVQTVGGFNGQPVSHRICKRTYKV